MSTSNSPLATERLETRRIAIFTAFVMGAAVLAGIAIYLTGGVEGSANVIDGLPIPAYVVVTTLLMGIPALGHVFTRFVTGEGWDGMLLKPDLKHGWQYWLAGWFLPALLTITGAAIFFVLFPQYFDASAANIAETTQAPEMSLITDHVGGKWGFVTVRLLQTLLFVTLFNAVFAFGEEFGWRAYLLPKLMPLGGRKASVLVGIIWGIWHWPLVLMGHNYGLDYPGAPWLGMLAMLWFTTMAGVILGWLTIRSGSVWPATLAHGANNAFFSLGVFVSTGSPNPIYGPSVAGVVGSLGWVLFAVWLLLRWDSSNAFEMETVETRA